VRRWKGRGHRKPKENHRLFMASEGDESLRRSIVQEEMETLKWSRQVNSVD
jgi:hypothetical protein